MAVCRFEETDSYLTRVEISGNPGCLPPTHEVYKQATWGSSPQSDFHTESLPRNYAQGSKSGGFPRKSTLQYSHSDVHRGLPRCLLPLQYSLVIRIASSSGFPMFST